VDLTLDALDVTLGLRAVLHQASASLKAGRITAVLGPNGAGKTTLLRTAAALVKPASGSVLIGEQDVASLTQRARARMIGYLPQDATVHWNIVARDVVALGRLPHRNPAAAPSPADRDAIARAMAATDTTPLADRPVAELSGGERARVLLARVLAGEPAWLLADEPLASLDPAHQIDLVDRLRVHAAAGVGVMLVLHDLVQAQRAADDALLIDAGRIVAAGPVGQVLTPDRLASAFGIRVAAVEDQGRRLWVPVGRA
jgi:iron complex transport system ATP-binding protein